MKDLFLSIDEQIETLEEKGLKILKKNFLRKHLFNFNYRNCISHYNFFFVQGDSFKKNVTSTDMINIFRFDNEISIYLLDIILKIERRLTTSIAYVLNNQMYKKHKIDLMKYGRMLKISNKDFKYFFPKIKISDFKNELTKYIENDREIIRKYKINETKEHIKDIPLWELSNFWTFKTTIKIIESTRKEIKSDIVKYFLNSEKKKLDIDAISLIIDILKILNYCRNRMCHNNKIFDINISSNSDNVVRWMSLFNKEYSDIKHKYDIRLMDICQIIDILSSHIIKYKVTDGVYKIMEKYGKKFFHIPEIWNDIKKYTRFNK